MRQKIVLKSLLCFVLLTNFKVLAQFNSIPNTLTDTEKQQGWSLLFDGQTLEGWHLYNLGKIPSSWTVKNGELVCDPNTDNVQRGDLVSDQEFENFDFQFEWKIAKGGNSGAFINVQENPENPTAWTTGPEYQLLDNANMTKDYLSNGKHSAGCIYSLFELTNPVTPFPAGKWNNSRIVQQNGMITFWLNGILTGHADMKSANWNELVSKSKLGNFPFFGKALKGKIAFQDWVGGVALRSIKIKVVQ